ncbi:MAG: lytic transglycosylase domain-containing protein [Terracidiphilus sp.]|jgi:soluble lytic murein transglycosylase-like protein
MQVRIHNSAITLAALAALAVLPPAARAGERVTLSNGFVELCDHHAQVEGRVRLYLSTGEDNYIELAPTEIAAIEQVPDPPAPAESLPAPGSAHLAQAKLTPADLREMLSSAGSEHNIDVDLLASVVKAESDFDSRAVSRAGAKGLMQLMPGTAADLGVHDSFEPEQNVRGGSTYLDALLTRYHDNLALALAAYNAGPDTVDKYHGIPPYHETRAYVARVIHEFNRRVLAREANAQKIPTSATQQPASSH